MRKHRHLPFVAIFCLLLSGFCSVRAQQQAGKTELLYPTLPTYECAASSHWCIRIVWVLACMLTVRCGSPSAPQLPLSWGSLRTQTLANARGAFLSMLLAGGVPLKMLCRGWGCGMCNQGGPEWVAQLSLGQSCFALLACVRGHFAAGQTLPLTCRKAVWLFFKKREGAVFVFGTIAGVTRGWLAAEKICKTHTST